jgi:hypothetical protein
VLGAGPVPLPDTPGAAVVLEFEAAEGAVAGLDVVDGADDDFELSDPHAAAIVVSVKPSAIATVFPGLGTLSPFSAETRLPRCPPPAQASPVR